MKSNFYQNYGFRFNKFADLESIATNHKTFTSVRSICNFHQPENSKLQDPLEETLEETQQVSQAGVLVPVMTLVP